MAGAVAVMVHAIEARDLKPKNSSGMIDPILSIEVLGEKRFTPKFKQDLAPYFNHYFHIENDKAGDISAESLVISVFDTGTMFRKELIGAFSFELADIHRQKNHEYFRVWTLLTSTDNTGKSVVRGYLKLSVTVLKPGDVPAQHDEPDEDETDSADEDLSKMVLLKPKGLEGVDNVLRAKFFRAENLPKMDTMGSVDPLVEVKFGTSVNRTSTIKGNYNPTWLEELHLPVILPTVADNVIVRLQDFDVGKDPELIGQKVISLKEIQTPAGKNWGTPQWLNFYRNQGSQGETQDYAGRVLASFSVLQAEAKLAVVKTGNEPEPPTSTYTIALDLFEIQGLHKGEYYVVVSCGPHTIQSTKKKALSEKEHANGLVEFYENVPDLDVQFPTDTSQVPDIFVYVYEDVPGDDKRIGYLRYTYQQFAKLGPSPKWETLKRKSSASKDDENFNVSVQLKASISTQKAPRAKVNKPPKKFYQLRAHIFMGSNLPAGDEDALSDPYLVVGLGGARRKTKVQEHTIYPDWYETVVLDVELPEVYPPDIHLTVYDYDQISSDEFLGRVSVPLPKLSSSSAVPEPQWYRLSLRDQVPGRGEVLASFQLLPQESKSAPLPHLRPPLIDAEIDVGIIGLKDLAPFRLLPVSSPYIKFSVGGARHGAQTRAVKGHKGNASFCENVKLTAQVPENGMFMPALLVEVFDKRPIKDVLVGTTSVPLSTFAPWLPKAQQAPNKYVELPPVVSEDTFYQPPAEQQTTATPTLPTPPAPKGDQAVIIEMDVDDSKGTQNESQSLLDKGKGKNGALEVRRDIPTTTVPGTEDEPEPPQPPQLPAEVEHTVNKFPFVDLDLFRGTSQGISSGNLFNRPDAVVGSLKASISVIPLGGKVASSSRKAAQAIDVSQIAKNRPYVLRVYIETGHNLVPHDDNGYSDPYVVISTGKQIIKDVENVKMKTLQPEYYKMYQLRGNLPEENQLKVQLYDKDTIGADEFMGETKYDLEMLWFTEEWRKLNPKPKEFRTLWSTLSSFPQGKLKMWIELLTPEEAAVQEPYPIGPPKKEPFELRIIVWETKNVVPKDKILGKDSSDQFVVTKLLQHAQTQQQTDVHDSVMDGCGKFNWRIVYGDVLLPYDVPRLKIQVFDKDRIGPNDAIAEANLNLKGFFQKGLRNGTAKIGLLTTQNIANQTLQITNTSKEGSTTAGPYNSGQWLDLFHPSFEGVQGTICMELELLAREEALKKPAGRGRGEPNQHPFLPEPVRPKREWFSDLFKFLGLDKLKKYIIMGGIGLLVILILFLIIYFAI